ncbi:DUF3592 domain-containing protein [Streptantibioticus silvisoli]|uniref:DUF3592 domain-containing protein n=1 Tax=Streptantibioticus silvisoli TaxID=2705255 RepID=A0ABT6VRY0_9ACTN|nr:DUF3592 domain-containing protein [Streptantibioticus silvisoli]MDI5961230.1 DUF3592 domain-containing protein [Streptantibioticus silvisoli]
MTSFRDYVTGRRGRAVAGGILVADGIVGIDGQVGRKRAGILSSLVVLVVGLVFVGVGVYVHRQHQPYANGMSTTGTVTGVQTSRNDHGQPAYAPVIAFTAASGRRVTVTEPNTSSVRPTVGGSVQLSYRKGDPQSARVIPAHDWVAFAVTGIGGLTALIGAITFVIRLKTLLAGLRLLIGSRGQHG